MSRPPEPGPRRSLPLSLLALAAFASFCALHWANLLSDPPVGRVIGVVAIALALATALALVRRLALGRVATVALAVCLTMLAIVAGLAAAGIPIRLLVPGGWGELRTSIEEGIASLGGATYPYRAGGTWARLALVAALPAALCAASAVAFWPLGNPRRLRAIALVFLTGLYAFASVLYEPRLAVLNGAVLLALISAWLWAPGLGHRRPWAAAAALGAATVASLPLSGALARDEPLVNYRSWTWTGGEPAVSFAWNHSYDTLDWPREGTALLEISSEVPHYWRSVVLERFDGYRWVRVDPQVSSLELPNEIEGTYSLEHPEWVDRTEVTVRELRSGFVVGPGSIQGVDGLEAALAGDGTVLAGELPDAGDEYAVTSYAPDPSSRQMEAAEEAYPPALRRFTQIELPTAPIDLPPGLDLPQLEGAGSASLGTTPVQLPLRGQPPSGAVRKAIAASGYGGVYDLTRRLTGDAATNYDAVIAVERYFQSGFTYSEEASAGDRPLRSFLLRTRTGYCQQYSGGMALMLRMAGIPARVVSGFSPGAPDLDRDDVYTVRDTDAHSWVEAYFVGLGWVPFDPTPSASPADLQSSPNAVAATPGESTGSPNGRAREPDALGGPVRGGSGAGGGDFPDGILLGLLALTAAGATASVLVRRARFAAARPDARLDAQVHELASTVRRDSRSPGRAPTLLDLERRFRDGGRRATVAYVAALRSGRYARSPVGQPGLRERRAVRRELGRRRGLRERLRLLQAIPPGGPALKPLRRV